MEIIKLTDRNIEDEHICCAFSNKLTTEGYKMKKEWLKTEFRNGYSFQKMDVRGKVFIEYVPIEHSWLPLEGLNFMVINCFWVSGKYKGKGNGKRLLKQCLDDARVRGMDGVVAISSDKKRPFMSDPKFFRHQGFEVVDEALPFFKLWGMKFGEEGTFPRILDSAKLGVCPNKEGITAYYSNSCPFTDYYTNQQLKAYGKEKGVPVEIHHIDSQEMGQKMPIPWIIASVFYEGELVTLEVKANRHLDKLIGG